MGEGSGVAMNSGVGHRCGLDPKRLWLWCRLVAAAPIRPLPWELPSAAGVALEKQTPAKTSGSLFTAENISAFQQKGKESTLSPPIRTNENVKVVRIKALSSYSRRGEAARGVA